MLSQLWPALRINIFLTILLGVAYPLAVTGVSQILFPHQANGSLITKNGQVVGSELLGQNFSKPEYFQPRPSAAGNDGYDPTASGGFNQGPTSPKFRAWRKLAAFPTISSINWSRNTPSRRNSACSASRASTCSL
jgi:potassium-transporting ATPase KdpC subunit